MTTVRTQSGKALPLVLGVAALAILAFLLVADPLGLGLLGGSGGAGHDEAPDLLGADAPEAEGEGDAQPSGAVGLSGRYGAGDMGAIRMRLTWVDSRSPLAGQPVKLFSRRGTEVADLPSDAAGVVMFNAVTPGRGYRIEIQGEGFSPVALQGISVFPQATNDLGDIVLGKDVVIRGRVIDTQGRPVPGTAVSVNTIIRGLASKGMLVYMAEQAATIPPPLRAATSDDEGYFTVSSLDDGIYSLLARHAGYATKSQSDVIVAKERGADMITIVLGDGATVSGRVLDADGKPIAGAQVMAVAGGRRMAMMRSMQREMAYTDDAGRYVIDTLSSGEGYRFGVVAKGYAPTYDVSETEVEKALERNFTLVKGGNLTGVVTDEATGKPVEGARVAVYVGEMGFGGRAQPGAKASADVRITDKDGRFTFEAITPGPVSSAVVQKPGYVSASFSRWPPPGNMWAEVKADETTEVTCALKRGGIVRGIVKSDAGEPIAGAEVTLMGTGWAAMGSMWIGTPSAMSGADGSYELVGVNPGTYSLMAYADGFSPPGGEEGVQVEIGEGGGDVTRDLELISAGAVTGVVKDPNGEPIAGANIRIRAGPTEGGGGRGNRRFGRNMARQLLTSGATPADRTDDEGRFRLTGIGTDTMWVVYAESDEYISGESKPFKLSAGDVKEVEITMMVGGSLRGVVVDDQGQRLAGARVQVGRLSEDLLGKKRLNGWEARRALGSEVYTTDEEGRFFAPNLKPGRQLVRASKDGFVTHFKRNITIRDGEAFENYTVALSRGETIEGIVLGADGRPLRRATVSVTTDPNPGSDEESADDGEASEDVEPTMFARTDDKGRFKIENIKPGTYNVVVWFASGHKGWMRDNSEAAMHRDVVIPGAPEQRFKLEKADPVDPAAMMGGGNRNRGGR